MTQPSQNPLPFAIVLLILLSSFAAMTAAQETFSAPDFGTGEFEKIADEMGHLFQLTWNGKHVEIKRDWDDRSANKERKAPNDANDVREQLIDDLVDRGFNRPMAERMADSTLQRLGANAKVEIAKLRMQQQGLFDERRMFKASGMEKAVIAVGSKFKQFSSSNSGAANGKRTSFDGSEFSGTAIRSYDKLRFDFEEHKALRRKLSIRDSGTGQFHFQFSSDDWLVDLRQQEKGKIRFAIIDNDDAKVFVADNFAELTKKHSEPVNRVLYPLMRQLGIKLPLLASDSLVVSAALQRLAALAINSDDELKRLFSDLDSENFEKRNAASETIEARYQNWSSQIKDYAEGDSVSTEARIRLKRIIAGTSQTDADKYIDNERLLRSPAFLVDLLKSTDSINQQHVIRQLEKVTGQTHGNNIEAWNEWLKLQ